MSFFLRSCLLACVALASACSSSTTGTGDDDAIGGAFGGDPSAGDARRVLTATAVADGTSTVVTAMMLDEVGKPAMLRPDEVFVAGGMSSSDQELTLTSDGKGTPLYRAQLPAWAYGATIGLKIGRRGSLLQTTVASMQVSQSFTIQGPSTTLRVGEELRMELELATPSPPGKPQIRFEGGCLPEAKPLDVQTYGSGTEARFDTSRLVVSGGGCSVTATLMFVNERSVFGDRFDNARSPASKGIQERRLTFYLSR